MERLTIHNIHKEYSFWKKLIELDYDLLGLADDIFVSPLRYYFSPNGFGLILSRDVLIISGKDKDAVMKEVQRLEKKLKRTKIPCLIMH
jgi:hypothetical protein